MENKMQKKMLALLLLCLALGGCFYDAGRGYDGHEGAGYSHGDWRR
jgi:hypothetical protein